MLTVTLIVVLHLPAVENPVIHREPMDSIRECIAEVREMVNRAPHELTAGGTFSAGCLVDVPKSENP